MAWLVDRVAWLSLALVCVLALPGCEDNPPRPAPPPPAPAPAPPVEPYTTLTVVRSRKLAEVPAHDFQRDRIGSLLPLRDGRMVAVGWHGVVYLVDLAADELHSTTVYRGSGYTYGVGELSADANVLYAIVDSHWIWVRDLAVDQEPLLVANAHEAAADLGAREAGLVESPKIFRCLTPLESGQFIAGLVSGRVVLFDESKWQIAWGPYQLSELRDKPDDVFSDPVSILRLSDGWILVTSRHHNTVIFEPLPDGPKIHRKARLKQRDWISGGVYTQSAWVHRPEAQWFGIALDWSVVLYDHELNLLDEVVLLEDQADEAPRLWCLAASPDGRHLFAGTSDGQLFVMKLSRDPVKVVEHWSFRMKDTAPIFSVAVTANGKQVVCGMALDTLRVFEDRPGEGKRQ